MYGRLVDGKSEWEDETFKPDVVLNHGDHISTDEYSIEVIHTPGHASNHLCFYIKDFKCLLTGDHIMDGSTVVIGPPDGSMQAYLDSLELLKNYDIDYFAPGHGNYMQEPLKTIDSNNDGIYTPADYEDNFKDTYDIDGDGYDDYPDFEVKNSKTELRFDYDPNDDINLTYQSGYSVSKTNQVSGVGRYLADNYEYTYYQLRGRYKNWFSQLYVNQGNSGDTRGYMLGDMIKDGKGVEIKNAERGINYPREFYTEDGLSDVNQNAITGGSSVYPNNLIEKHQGNTVKEDYDRGLAPKYPYNHMIESEGGHIIEMDDTDRKSVV